MIINPYIFGRNTLYENLYAVYKAESSANDTLGNYNATAFGGLTYVSGKSGDCFNGNGTNAYVSLPNNALNFTNSFSVSFWDYPNALSTDIIIGNYNASATRGWSIYHAGAGKLRFYQFNASGSQWTEFNTSIGGSFKHYSFVKTWNNQVKCYENGIEISVSSSSGTQTLNPEYSGTHSATILAANVGGSISNYCSHKIDEIYFHTKSLTTTEITDLQTKFYPF